MGGHGPEWLTAVLQKMGTDPGAKEYLRPTGGGVWRFMQRVAQWIANPRRKGMMDEVIPLDHQLAPPKDAPPAPPPPEPKEEAKDAERSPEPQGSGPSRNGKHRHGHHDRDEREDARDGHRHSYGRRHDRGHEDRREHHRRRDHEHEREPEPQDAAAPTSEPQEAAA